MSGFSAVTGLADFHSIHKAVVSLCSSFGRIRYCLFEHNREERVLQCYVQLTNRELHDRLAHRLGGYVRGRELYVPIAVPANFVMPRQLPPLEHARA